jgi:uncharacterized protein (DUF2062 family)
MAYFLFHLDDTPHRIALSFAIGVFIAFFPILGIHTGLALLIAFAFRLSRVAILAGAWTNNPWTTVPMLMGGTFLGCVLFDVPSTSLGEVQWHLHGQAFYQSLWDSLRPLVLPYVVGNLVLGVLCAVVSYLVLRTVLERRRQPAAL